MEFKPTILSNGFNLLFNDYNTFKPYIKVKSLSLNNNKLKDNNDLIKEYNHKKDNEKTYKLNLKSNNEKIDLKDFSIEFIDKKRENCLYPNIAINEKNINGIIYPINIKDIYEYSINQYDKIEFSLIIKRLKDKSINNEFLLLLSDEFNINSKNLFLRINKDINFKDFCFNYMNYCLKTNLNFISKKGIKDLLLNNNKSNKTLNQKVKMVLNYLKEIGFISDITLNKPYWFYRVIKSKTYDGLSINKKEIDKFIIDKNNKDLFDLLGIKNNIKPNISFKPYGYTMFKNGYVKKYYIFKDRKKTYITYCNVFENIKPIDLKIKVFNMVFNTYISKKIYLNNDFFIIKNSLTHNKPIKIFKKDFKKIYKKLNISMEIVSNRKPINQKVITLNTFSHKLVSNNMKIKGFMVNKSFNLSKIINRKPIIKDSHNKLSYKDLLNLLKK